MKRSVRSVLLGLIVVSGAAFARDSVSIRYLPGYPVPDRSAERLDVRIERVASSTAAGSQEVDRFFASVEAMLSEHRIVRDWQVVIPDSPAIEIAVDLNGRRIRLASSHVPLERSGNTVVTERGVEALAERSRDSVLARQSEAFRRHRLAFERLLELSLQRLRAHLSP